MKENYCITKGIYCALSGASGFCTQSACTRKPKTTNTTGAAFAQASTLPNELTINGVVYVKKVE